MLGSHAVHLLANAVSANLVGQVLFVASPQGRSVDGIVATDGLRLLGAEAWGKQMFLLFSKDLWLRVHLAMYGM